MLCALLWSFEMDAPELDAEMDEGAISEAEMDEIETEISEAKMTPPPPPYTPYTPPAGAPSPPPQPLCSPLTPRASLRALQTTCAARVRVGGSG